MVAARWTACLLVLSAVGQELRVADPTGAAGRVGAPVSSPFEWEKGQRVGTTGELLLVERGPAGVPSKPMTAQLEFLAPAPAPGRAWWLLPPGAAGQRVFAVKPGALSAGSNAAGVEARLDSGTGQVDVREDGRPVLRYVYRTMEPGAVLARVSADNRKYAVARSDYLHPVFGLDGEELTLDWPVDHPHHRGIYWAWPEVDYGGERGDLHALQRVFARPTGQLKLVSGPVFAQIEAENLWTWENGETIAHERARIRAYHQGPQGRCLDLRFEFRALKDGVSVARRGTDKYGGLNIRLAAVNRPPEIAFHSDAVGAQPRMAWAEFAGAFATREALTSLAVFQKLSNPDYPGDWVKFPEIGWFQPTFPAAGTRYPLKKDQPLVLEFRLWVHRGGPASAALCADQWRAYHLDAAR